MSRAAAMEPRRMLTKREAALYCGVPLTRFPATVSVQPIAMPHGQWLSDQTTNPLTAHKEAV